MSDAPRKGRWRALAGAGAALKRLDSREALVSLARAGRRKLPGDARYGDPLSLSGDEAPQLLGRGISALAEERPSAMRELGMSALQVWQGLSEAQGRGQGDRELAILFTDLVDFSEWALDAGDTNALELLRQVGLAVEQPVKAHDGRVVKRLGDGVMAVFEDPAAAVQAACEASREVAGVRVNGYKPQLRAGVHVGRPRRLGGDYFGVDVNVAARVAEAAGAGEVLISEAVHSKIEGGDTVQLKRRWRFSAKGAPKGLKVYAAEPS